jgi:hypothetical protein
MPTYQAVWADGSGGLPAKVKPDVLTENFEFKLFNTGRDEPLEKALESLGVKPTLAVSSQPLSTFVPQKTGWKMDQLTSIQQNN